MKKNQLTDEKSKMEGYKHAYEVPWAWNFDNDKIIFRFITILCVGSN